MLTWKKYTRDTKPPIGEDCAIIVPGQTKPVLGWITENPTQLREDWYSPGIGFIKEVTAFVKLSDLPVEAMQ